MSYDTLDLLCSLGMSPENNLHKRECHCGTQCPPHKSSKAEFNILSDSSGSLRIYCQGATHPEGTGKGAPKPGAGGGAAGEPGTQPYTCQPFRVPGVG